MLRRVVCFASLFLIAAAVHGASFTSGNIVVYRVGDGSAALNSNATAAFLDEYLPSTAAQASTVQTIAFPTTTIGANKRMTCSGSQAEGFLMRSVDGSYLLVGGYDAATGTATPAGVSSATINRVVARIDTSGAINTTTSLTDAASSGNFRAIVSTNGTDLWVTGSAGGVRYTTLGATTSTQLSTTVTNIRTLGLFAGYGALPTPQLYLSTASGTFQGVASVGSGTPTTSGQTTTLLPGFPTAAGPSSYMFFVADLSAGVAGPDTIYVADDRASPNGGIQKWTYNGTTWSLTNTIGLSGTRGITGTVSGTNVTLWVTDGGTLRTLTDTAGHGVANNGTLTTLATAPTNTAFRGVAFAPAAAAPAPTVSSILRANTNPTNAASVDYTVTFSQSVTGVDSTDFTVTMGGGVTGASVTGVSGSGTTYTVTVNTGSNSGTIRLDVTDNDSITNGTTPLGGAGAGNGNFTTGEVYTIDKTPPAVQSITRASTNPTNATSVNFTVSFGESVSGLDTGDFTLTTTGVSGASISGVTGSGPYTVSVNTGSGDGTIRLDFVSNGTVTDGVGNMTIAGFTAGEVYTIDKTPPAVTSIVRANTNPTSAASVDFTVTFSESVTSVGTNDFTLTTTGVSGASITGVTGSGPYTVSVNTGTGTGTIRLDAINNATIFDTVGNQFTTGFTTGEVYTVTKTAPAVVSINRASSNPTNNNSVDFTVTFSTAVNGVDAGDFALALSGVTGSIFIVASGDGGTTWTVVVNSVSGNGTLGLNLVDDDSITAVSNSEPLGGPGTGNGNFTGQVYTVDQLSPTVSSSVRASANPTNATSVDFTVTFSETVTGVDSADFTLTTTGVSGASITGVTGSGPYTVSVNTGSGDGTIRLDVVDNDTIADTAGNNFNAPFNTGEVYTIDKTVPSVQSITRASADPNPGPSVAFTVTFNENVSGVDNADFTTFTTGAITGTSVTGVTGGPMVYTVNVNTGTNSGTLRLDFVDNDTVLDTAGNTTASGFTSGEVYTINAPTPAPTGLVGAVSSGKVALSWNAVGVATSYNVKRGTTPGGPYSTIASPGSNSHNDTTVVNGTRYYYVVTAVGPSGESANSAEIHAKPDVPEALGVDISQTYGNGGNTGATYQNDFIEIFNRGNSAVDLTGWSVQYASAAGTTWTPTNLSGTIKPGQHFLVHEGAGASCSGSPCGSPLPSADATGAIAMSGSSAKVALVSSTTALSGGCPTGAGIIDFVGYGTGLSCFEGAGGAATASAANSQQRASNGCVDTNNNTADFSSTAVNPRNNASAFTPCSVTAIGSATPLSVSSGGSVLLRVELPPSIPGGAIITADLTAIGGSASQGFFDNATNGDVTANDNIFSFQTTATASAGLKSLPVNANAMPTGTANTSILLTITPPLETIAAVKVDTTPADTVPDRNGQAVLVRGVVTSIDFRGGTGIEYYIQDTTAGIDVFSTTDVGPSLTVGANVEVGGTITQFNGLTEISPTSITLLAPGTLPPVTPQTVTLAQLLDGAGEPLEGKLIRVDNLTVTSGTFPASGASGNVTVNDGSNNGTIRIDSDTDIDGTTAPSGIFSVIGLVSQSDTTNPFDAGYQILPRSTADIIPRTNPTGVGGANPPSVAPGGTTLLTVNVTLGQNPPSTGVTVVVNLSSIGLSASQTFFDNGTNGDVSPGDNVFSYSAVVDNATPLGPKSLPVQISDAQARGSSTSISLNIQSASAPNTPTNLIATPGNQQISLNWDAVAGSTGYNVKRSLVNGGPYTTIAPNIAPNSYTDTGLSNGTHYYYVVSALSGANESGNSNQADATPSAPPPSGSLLKIYFVDIGQGAGTLVVSPSGKSMLIDGGPTGQGNAKVIPLLNTVLGPTGKVDYLVLTHYHVDHDAGLTEVINAGRVSPTGIAYDNGDAANVVPPVPSNSTGTAYTAYKSALTSQGITRQTATPGTTVDLGSGVRATFLAQGGNLASGGHVWVSGTDLNSSSVSTLIEFNNFDYVVSGDLTGGGQTTTAKTPDVETFVAQMAGDIDFVQLDHHGSTTANGRRFLSQLKAEGSLASIGVTNTFGHPNRETFNKYLNIPVTSGNTYGGETLPNPGNGPVAYQTDASPPTDNRTTVQGYSGASSSNGGQGTILLKTDGTVSYSMESFDDGGVRISPSAHVYALDGQGNGLASDFPPTVIPFVSPVVPTAADVVTVTALVNDNQPITSVTLNYSLNGAAQAPATMSPTVGSEYATTIPAQPNGTRVDYTVTAVANGLTTSYSGGYFSGTTSIATLRSLNALFEPAYLDYTARISGLVTSGTGNYSSTNNDDYIDDGTGALNISRTIEPTSPATQPTSTGNTYTVAGFINQLTGRFRLDVTPPFDGVTKPWDLGPGSFNGYSITLTGSGTVTPLARTIAQINADPEGHDAKLVTIANCTVTSGTIPASGGTDGFLTINDGTGSIEMKIDGDGDIPGLATPAGTFTLTGIVQQDDFLRPFNARYDIAPRNRTDLGAAAGGPSLITIAQAREDVDPTTGDSPDDFVPDRLGQQVKIRGVVTSVDFRGASGLEIYIQDPTGGVDIFNTSINTAYNIGDNLEVTGTVAQFNGLTEINPGSGTNITVLPPGTLPTPDVEVVTLSQLNNGGIGEAYEGKLIRINNVTLDAPPATFGANVNYKISDATLSGVVDMRIDSDTDIDGTAPPAGTFSVIGVLGQFDSAGPFDSGYQLFPRIRASDFLPATPAPASISATAGTPQTTNINTAFATQLQATVRDSGSAPIAGIGVTFTAPASGASGKFANNTTTTNATTNASGVATASVFTANAIAGTYNVVASTASLTANFSLTNNDPSATHFTLTAPANVTNGVAFNVTVTARDAGNNIATGYTGTVHFTSSSTGTLPGNYTFTGGDAGSHTFSVTLTQNGSQSITATDTVTASITGTTNTTVNPPPATHFSVTAPANVTNGVAFNVTVTALDASNATVPGYTGTVHFTSSSTGTLPGDYTFTGGDAGSHTFSVTLTQNGAQSVTATDTVTASITGTANTTVNAAPATHFSVTAPANVTNGVAFNVTVTALDASNATVTGYTGTVHFTSSSTGTLPGDYTFTGGDAGSHTFSVTLTQNGPQSVTATDTVTASITGTANTTVNAAPQVATHFNVTAPANVTNGVAFNVTVTALDASNATVPGYTGTVHFTSSSTGTLPGDYTFTGGDAGSHTFSVTLTQNGPQSITATDTVTASITGTANTTVNAAPQVATHFNVTAPANVTNGVAFNVTVTALDASNATVPGYTGTVHFTSSSTGTLPGDYTFTGGDAGSHTFSVTLTQNGPQSVTATDTVTASITGTANTTVSAAPQVATHFNVTAPASVTNGVPFNVTVTALDASNATVPGYTGTVHFTSSSTGTLPGDYTFTGGDAGSHTFSVTLTQNGARTITATDTVTASITGTANTTVNPPPATHFNVTAPASVTNGVPFNVTVTALDASNATVPGYTGTVHFTSSSTGSLPGDYTFTGGDAGSHTFSVTLTQNGPQTITATDTVTASITGTANTTVNAAPQVATHFNVTAPANVTNGVAFNVTVTALDASNATVPGYTGTVHFTSTSTGTLPGDYTFTGGDAGSHTFSVTLTQNGSQSITATDTVTASITGTASVNVVCGGPPPPVATIVTSTSVCSNSPGHHATASPSTNYTWTITNGVITSGQGTASITYTAGASGNVQLTATPITPAGNCPIAQSGNATVLIRPRPTATLPSTINACAGVPVTVTATLTGSAPFSVTWSDGLVQPVPTNTATRTFTTNSNTTLQVTMVIDTHCVSSAASNVANVIVGGAPPVITADPDNAHILSGQTATLTVSTSSAGVSYQWYEGNQHDISNPVGTNSPSFTTPPLTHTTHYWVRLTNSCGSADSNQATVNVSNRRRSANH
jgi:beta-lactamase superfamily II metal-dependent hydrolase